MEKNSDVTEQQLWDEPTVVLPACTIQTSSNMKK